MKNPPEYRTFRRAVTVVYVALATSAGLAAIISTGIGAYARMGKAPAPAPLQTY